MRTLRTFLYSCMANGYMQQFKITMIKAEKNKKVTKVAVGIKVPKKKFSVYKRLLKGKGQGKKVVITKQNIRVKRITLVIVQRLFLECKNVRIVVTKISPKKEEN